MILSHGRTQWFPDAFSTLSGNPGRWVHISIRKGFRFFDKVHNGTEKQSVRTTSSGIENRLAHLDGVCRNREEKHRQKKYSYGVINKQTTTEAMTKLLLKPRNLHSKIEYLPCTLKLILFLHSTTSLEKLTLLFVFFRK